MFFTDLKFQIAFHRNFFLPRSFDLSMKGRCTKQVFIDRKENYFKKRKKKKKDVKEIFFKIKKNRKINKYMNKEIKKKKKKKKRERKEEKNEKRNQFNFPLALKESTNGSRLEKVTDKN